MEASTTGRIVLSNLMFEINEGGLDATNISALVRTIAALWLGRTPATAATAVFYNACSAPGVSWFSALPPPTLNTTVSRVVDADSLIANNIMVAEYATLIDDRGPESLIDRVETDGLLPNSTRNEMRGFRPLAWITKTSRLAELRAFAPDRQRLPSVARDYLGLRHVRDEVLMVEVVYPVGALLGARLSRPTIIEAGPGIIFRATRDGEHWGCTVCLRDLGPGVPELVHDPIPFTAEFRVRKLGTLTIAHETFRFEDLLNTCPHRWEPAMVATLESYC